MLHRGFGKTALIALLGTALAPLGAGAQGSPVKDLRLVDASGQPMEQTQIEINDNYYRVPVGTTSLKTAFEFVGTQATEVKLKVLGVEGAALYEESKSLDAPGTYDFAYDAKDQPMAEGEYVINLYLGKESYLADSVQVYVGNAQPPVSVATQQAQTPSTETVVGTPVTPSDSPVTGGDTGGSGNSSLLVLAGVGILALLGIVLWAGRSAMRRG